MSIWEAMGVALEGLVANKMRSALTMLGIIIGVGAVIVMFAVGEGATEQTLQRIQQQGSNVLTVRAGQMRQGTIRFGAGSVQNLTLDDADALTKDCPSLEYVAPDVSQNAQIKYLNQNTSTTVYGVTPDYPSIRNYQIAEGRFFTASEDKSYAEVAIMAPTAAKNLFGDDSPVGKMIRIRGIQFQVIGLTVAKGGAAMFGDPDDEVFVPLTTAMKRMFGVQKLREIVLQVSDQKLMDQAQAEADAVMTKRHPPSESGDQNYIIQNQQDMIDMMNQQTSTMTWLLASVALVSLLVGGIGVMNIMLVSVTERTREIGIRMAVGARSRDILRQFLVESLVLSIVGGTTGIVLGYAFAIIASHFGSWTMVVPPYAVGLSFGFSAIVGLVFGSYPAYQASRLNPIEALRYE